MSTATLLRWGRSVLWFALGVVLLALLYTGYKAVGQATGGTWPFTSIDLPVSPDDRTMPPISDIVSRFFEPQQRGRDQLLISALVSAALFTLRTAVVGLVAGFLIGMALAIVMLRWRVAERGLLPYVIISQTVPLIALVPIIVTWGNRISLPFMDWQPWMSVAVIATYLTFFPVAVNGLRGLQSPAPEKLELMRSYASGWNRTLFKLRFPSSVPYLIPALKLAAAAAIVGTIVGEISAGMDAGIGRQIFSYATQYASDPAKLYCAIIGAAVLGLGIVGLVGLLDLYLSRNRPRSEHT